MLLLLSCACIMSHVTSATEQRHLQPIEAAVGHPPAADNMKHCLTFATLTLALVARPHFFVAGCTVTLVSPKWVIFDQYRRGRSNPGCLPNSWSPRPTSSHLMTSMGWVSVPRGLRDGRQLQEGENLSLPRLLDVLWALRAQLWRGFSDGNHQM